VKQFVDAFPGYYGRAFELLQDLQVRFEALAFPSGSTTRW